MLDSQTGAKLSVPFPFTEDFIERLAYIDQSSQGDLRVGELFGSISSSEIGSLRPESALPSATLDDLHRFVREAHHFGYEFNFTMNATVLDGAENTARGRFDLCRFIERIAAAEVDRITVAVPLLIRLIRTCFPDMNVSASICLETASFHKARQLAEMGVDRIVLSRDVNRDLNTLRGLTSGLMNLGVDVELLATTPCLFQCPHVFYHGNLSSLESGSLRKSCRKPKQSLALPVAYCIRQKLENLSELISIPLIRPEDISKYHKLGVNHFKLDGRDKPADYVLEVAESYLQGCWDGNMLYLMQPYYPRAVEAVLYPGDSSSFELLVAIDNRKMDEFLDPFVRGDIACRGQCHHCDYCQRYAKKVVVCDESWRREFLENWEANMSISLEYLEHLPAGIEEDL